MKNILILFAVVFSLNSSAQKQVNTFTVNIKGNCGDCKKRIENASDIKGVKNCVWDTETKVAKITYRADKTNEVAILKAIAEAGHDADTLKANQTSYNNLPECCKYLHGECKEGTK